MIDIYVQRTRAKACADAPITSGSVGLVARFRFSEEWEELNKIAIFETDNYKEPVEIPEAGEVVVPDSVLVYPWTQLRVGVRGESEDGDVVIPTVYADCGTISLGANTIPVGTPPTPSQAEYLQAQIDELRESGIGGGITEETDPTVPAWAKAPEKPSYTAEEVGALPVGTEIPVVPSKVSAFENDKGYLTEQNLSGYAKSEDIPTKPSDVGAQPAGNYATKDEIPTTLPNPHKLTFSGAVEAEYDGSKAVEVVIPQGGSSGGGETWELIADVTTTEEVSVIDISADTNGNPFSLSKMDMLFCIVGTETNTENDALRVNINAPSTNTVFRIVDEADIVRVLSTQSRKGEAVVEVIGGSVTGGYSFTALNEIGLSNLKNIRKPPITGAYIPPLSHAEINSINSISVYPKTSGRVFGIGTIIRIYGVRA